MTPEEIVKGLTEAQKAVFAESDNQGAWFRDRRSEKSFVRRGLCEETRFGSNAKWTPLGQSVRALLEKDGI